MYRIDNPDHLIHCVDCNRFFFLATHAALSLSSQEIANLRWGQGAAGMPLEQPLPLWNFLLGEHGSFKLGASSTKSVLLMTTTSDSHFLLQHNTKSPPAIANQTTIAT
jgi:hypothetical protein